MNQNVPEIEVFERAITTHMKVHHNRYSLAFKIIIVRFQANIAKRSEDMAQQYY